MVLYRSRFQLSIWILDKEKITLNNISSLRTRQETPGGIEMDFNNVLIKKNLSFMFCKQKNHKFYLERKSNRIDSICYTMFFNFFGYQNVIKSLTKKSEGMILL